MTDEIINFLIYFTEKKIEKSKEEIKLFENEPEQLHFHLGEMTAYKNALQAIKAQLKSEEYET
tara:strand:+ start:606 stop:794 length:189 start_codon:yes stop_codon:yes gene_type:complete